MAKKKTGSTKNNTKSTSTNASTTPDYLPDLAKIFPVAPVALERFQLTPHRQRTIEPRAFQFLRGVNRYPGIFNILSTIGLSQTIVKQGWELLQAVNGAHIFNAPSKISETQREAEAELDRWDEPNFAIITASLMSLFPEQVDYLFDNLESSRGPAAVIGIEKLLMRLDLLEKGKDPNRKDTRKADKAAVQELEDSNILTRQERKRLLALVKQAKVTSDEDLERAQNQAKQETYQKDALKRLGLWLEKWTAIAKTKITKRSYLIALGLAERKKRKNTQNTQGSTDTSSPNISNQATVNTTQNNGNPANGEIPTTSVVASSPT